MVSRHEIGKLVSKNHNRRMAVMIRLPFDYGLCGQALVRAFSEHHGERSVDTLSGYTI